MNKRQDRGYHLSYLLSSQSQYPCSLVSPLPVAIKYFKDETHTTAKAVMLVPAEKLYRTALNMAEKKDFQILKRKMINSTERREERKEEQKELSLRISNRLCGGWK